MLPIMLNIENRKCVIIGGGKVALRKAKKLIEYGGIVTAVSTYFCDGFGSIHTVTKKYEKNDLNSAFIAVAATDDHELNLQICRDASEMNVLVSLADNKNVSDFIMPYAKTKEDITVSVSTNGKYPILSKKICEDVDIELYAAILPCLEKYRQKLIHSGKDTNTLYKLVSDEMIMLARNNFTEFERKIKEML